MIKSGIVYKINKVLCMSFRISIQPANIEFTTTEEENILSAALNAKINLPHGCKSGNCGACKCKITAGEVEHEADTTSITAEEFAAGYRLLCKAHAKSDTQIEIAGFINSFQIKTLPAKIATIDKIGTTAIVKLQLPAGQKFEFNAGQYIDIMYEGQNRSYSLANAVHANNQLELHIRYRPGGLFSEAIWNKLNAGGIVRFKGPLGGFALQESELPILLVCTGTGFAPIKAIAEHMIASNNKRQAHLIWGNFNVEDFYLLELLNEWQQKLNLKVSLCINENAPDGFKTGLVTDLIQTDYSDLSGYEVYACGNPQMITSMYELATTQLKLSAANFFSDSFTPSK